MFAYYSFRNTRIYTWVNISEYYFQNQWMLIGKYIFVIFLSLFAIRNFRVTCSYNEMLKGYMDGESLGTLVLNLNLGDRL